MNKRILSAGLWLFVSLYAGAILHETVGLHELVGPVLGFVTAGAILATGMARRSIELPAPSEVNAFPAGAVDRF
jgi:hypothetical protein